LDAVVCDDPGETLAADDVEKRDLSVRHACIARRMRAWGVRLAALTGHFIGRVIRDTQGAAWQEPREYEEDARKWFVLRTESGT
jgi:hypothetical protein